MGLLNLGTGGGLSCFISWLPLEKDPGWVYKASVDTKADEARADPAFLAGSRPAPCLLDAPCLSGSLALRCGVLPGTAGPCCQDRAWNFAIYMWKILNGRVHFSRALGRK